MRYLFVLLLVGLFGCPQPKPGTDRIPLDGGGASADAAQPGEDAGIAKDAGMAGDAGSADAEVDAGPEDAAVDGGPNDAGPDAGPPRATAAFTTSAGGGVASSPGYRLRLIIGPPTPVGVGSGPSYRLFLGAGPAQHGQ